MLLSRLPHLVLDGAAVAARATAASEVTIAVPAGAQRSLRSLEFALIERHEPRLPGDPRFELHPIEERYISARRRPWSMP